MYPWVSPQLGCGLGNRLFQFAAAAGAAERWGRPLVFYLPSCMGADHGAVATLMRMFPSVPVLEDEQETQVIPEPGRRFYEYIDPGPAPPLKNGNLILSGFRQSPLYFPKNPTALQPNWEHALGGAPILRALQNELSLTTAEERERSVAVHVRLGDFKFLAHHQIPIDYYYHTALEQIKPGQCLILFSDDPNLCTSFFASWASLHGVEFAVARKRADIETLYQMSHCLGGTIAANSTFSWWAAWFAHEAGAPWATFPDSMGQGQPEPVDYYPSWATILPIRKSG